jgi:AraC-like DNA-binding protein
MERVMRHEAFRYRIGLDGVDAMAFATGHHFPRHAHGEFGLGLVLSGGHRSWSGRGFVDATPGDLITVNPGEMHDGAPIGRTPRRWRMIYLRPALIKTLTEGAPETFEFRRPAFGDPTVSQLFSRLFDALTGGDRDNLLVEQGLVALFGAIERDWSARPTKRDAPPAISRALQRIDDDPSAALSLAELATLAGVSRFQLLRGFARHVGATPHAYLMQRRAQIARDLLLANQSPAQAAAAAGFSDQSHLTRVFSRQFCMTPGKFRAANAV